MDIADDIAYSTYDFEDALKAGFLIPLDLAAADDDILEEVSGQVSSPYGLGRAFSRREVEGVLREIVSDIAGVATSTKEPIDFARAAYRTSHLLANSGYNRTDLTSQVVGEFIQGVRFEPNEEIPALSKVYLTPDIHEKVEVLNWKSRSTWPRSSQDRPEIWA